LDYYNVNDGKPAAQRVAVLDYLASWLPGRGAPAAPARPAAAAQPVAAAPQAGGGLMATASGLFARLTGGDEPPPVDLSDPASVEAALRSGNVEAVGAAAEAQFAAVAAALEAGGATAAAPAAGAKPKSKKPGQITVGSGTCGARAGGKFCSVGD
jgi:hypothetical protein